MPNKVSSKMVDYKQSATATTRSLESRLQDSVSVLDYGADPTGAVSSSTAIAAALASGAGTVHFPAGTYLISTTLAVPANTTLTGTGQLSAALALQAAAARAYIMTLAGGVVIDGLSFDVDETLYPDNASDQAKVGAISATSVDNIVLRNCKFTGGANKFQATGFLLTPVVEFDTCDKVRVTDCEMTGTYTVGFSGSALASELLYFTSCNDVQVTGGSYRGSYYSCIAVSGTSTRVLVDGVHADTCIGSVVSLNAATSICSNSVLGLSRDQTGVAMGHATANAERCKVTGCTIYECGRSGLTVAYKDAVVTNNTIYDCDQLAPTDLYAAGIAIGDASGTPTLRNRAVVSGNVVRNCYHGIVVSDSSVAGEDGSDYTITGNVVTGCTDYGIYTQASKSVIVGNVCRSNDDGIIFANARANNSVCIGNAVADNTTTGIGGSDSGLTNVVMMGNMLTGNGSNNQAVTAAQMYMSTSDIAFNNPSTALVDGDNFFKLTGKSNDASTGASGRSGGVYHECDEAFGSRSRTRFESYYVTGGVHTFLDTLQTGPRGMVIESQWHPGTDYYLWVDTTGRLRIKSSAPTSATDGTVVGTQT